MEILTVEDLKKFESGTTFNITKRLVTGKVILIEKENPTDDRGSFLLVDPTTNRFPIPCWINVFTPQQLNVPLFIKHWVYIKNEESDIEYIQIQLEHTFKSVDCNESVYLKELKKCNHKFNSCLNKKVSFQQPSVFLSSSITTPTNMTGILSAKSALSIEPGSPACFFIQLVDTEKDTKTVTISIMFSGDNLIKYYTYLQIGVPYMFLKLDLAIIGNPQHTIFSYIDTQSKCYMITMNQYYNQIRIEQPTLSQSTWPPLVISQYTKPRNSTYTGTITRVVDSLFGVYELDKKMLVCLFHYMSYSPATPYRLNTVLKLHHVHVAFVQPEDGQTSHLFQHLWRAPQVDKTCRFMVLVACAKSHIRVATPPHTHTFSESIPSFLPLSSADDQIKEFIYWDSTERHSSFSKLVRQLEIYAALSIKFNGAMDDFETFKRAYTQILKLTFKTTRTRASVGPRNFVNDFFKHETLCAAVGGGLTDNTFHVVVESYPFLNKVQEILNEKLQDDELKLPGSQEKRFERGHVPVQMAEYQLTENYCILGQLRSSGDGRLYLADHTSRVRVLIKGGQVGDFYMVRKCKWVQENLSFVEDIKRDEVVRYPIWSSYMVLEQDAMVRLNYQQKCFQVSSRAKQYRSSLENSSMVVMHVVSKYPIEMAYDESSQVYFCSKLVVQLRSVDGFANIDVDKKYVVTLSSTHKSLKWYHEMQVGTDWVVDGGLETRKTKIQLKADQHVIYPLVIGTVENGVQLEPVEVEDDQEPQTVYNVSDVLLASKNPELGTKAGPIYYATAVNVQGVVVNKRLIEGFKAYDKTDRLPFYEQLGVGTGKANRKLLLQLRELNGLDVMNLYIDVDRVHYPLGLVIGSIIRVHQLVRRGPAGSPVGVYGLVNEINYIEVVSTIPPSISPLDQETRTIASFLHPVFGLNEDESDEIFKLFVYIQNIKSLSMRWLCQECGSLVQKNDCYGMCQDAPRVFMANAYVEVSDGTSIAFVSIDGERLVFEMLRLTMKQADALKTLAEDYGEVHYGDWGPNKTMEDEDRVQKKQLQGFTLSDLCDKASESGQFWLFGKNITKPTNYKRKRLLELEEREDKRLKADLIEEFKLQRLTVTDNGRSMRTLEFQKLKLKAIDLEFPEASVVAYDILKRLPIE